MLTAELDAKIMQAIAQIEHSSLLKGDMGVCIFYHVYGRITKNKDFSALGDKMLLKVTKELKDNKRLDFCNGITGIALGIAFLIENGYVEGDVDTLLADIDSTVYKALCPYLETTKAIPSTKHILDILFYFLCRYKNTKDADMKLLFKEIIIASFNKTYLRRTAKFYDEPLPFSLRYDLCLFLFLLIEIYKLDIERERITYLLNEMKYVLFSRMPYLHSNRLYLMIACSYVAKVIDDNDWNFFSNQLYKSLDFDVILNIEMQDKNIFPKNGIIGICILTLFNNAKELRPIQLDMEKIKDRIIASSLWDRIKRDKDFLMEYYSLDGYCGVKLFLEITKNIAKYGK